jgi:methylthioribose-1-phosphate isomerase
VCNKIGTYLKALAAHDNGVPFYVAMPTSTLDLALRDGVAEIPIEERSAREVTHITGRTADGERGGGAAHARRQPGRQPGLRRDAGAAGDRADHRARRGRPTQPGRCAQLMEGRAMTPAERACAKTLVAALRRLDALGMNRGSTGNLSHRWAKAC